MEENNKKAANDGKIEIDRQHEEDESWISGEELYTEESTEEDEGKLSDNALQERKKKRENRRTKAKRQVPRQARKDASSSTDVGNNVDFLTEEDSLRNITKSSVQCVDHVTSRVDSVVDDIYEQMVKETKPFDEEKHAHLLKGIKMPNHAAELGGIYQELSTRDPTLNEALLKMYQLDKILEHKEAKLKALCQNRKRCCTDDDSTVSDNTSGSTLEPGSAAVYLSEACESKSVDEDDSSARITDDEAKDPAAIKEFHEYANEQAKVTLECPEDRSQLTDDEKRRIEEILIDYDVAQPDAGDSASLQTHSLQAFQLIDEETEKQLEAIEQQLKQLSASALMAATKFPASIDQELSFIEIESRDRPHGDDKYKSFSSESRQLLSDIDTKLKSIQVENETNDAHIRELLQSLQHSSLQPSSPETEDVSWNITEEDLQNLLLPHDESSHEVTSDGPHLIDLDGELVDTMSEEVTTDKSS